MSKKPETIFAEKVDRDLKARFGENVFFENIQQVVKTGTPDRLLCLRGRFVALELKTLDGKASPVQLIKLRKIYKASGLAYLISPKNWERTLKIIDNETRLN